MLYGYFDDSGTHREAVTSVMAGYVAHKADWRRFEIKSKQLFQKEGIEYFHAKLFDHRKKQFKGWDIDRRRRFAETWYKYANQHILKGISAGMLKADFYAAKEMDKKLPGISCSAYCMQMAIAHLCRDKEIWEEIEKHGLHIIVESSTVADSGIRTDFDRLVAANEVGEHLRSISFADKKSSRGLQLGDYLAYYSQRFAQTAIYDSLDGATEFLDLAQQNVQTIMKLGENFKPNPNFRERLSSLKKQSS